MAATDAGVPAALSGKTDARSFPQAAPNQNNATATAAQSKRDRRRQALMDRLTAMTDKFQHERDVTYRDQLQKIQFDTNLVQRFDPYDPKALDVIAELQKEHIQQQGAPVNPENARSLLDMAGTRFIDFVEEVEDLLEVRDFQLARSKNEYDRKVQQYKNTYTYKVETAKREHRALTNTLRDRLINTLTQKKNRLNREKEVLEINDSNALLLNPNQFSLTNPASPGGAHGKRATRLRRDADDLQQMYSNNAHGGNSHSDGKKRKRHPGGEDDSSPAPSRRGGADSAGGTTSLWQSEKARAAAKQNGPVYSIDKLFTDKELSLHYNTAALAAHQYILRTQKNGNGSSPDDSDANMDDLNDELESLPSAPMMERNVSHATRSTRGGNGNNHANNQLNFLDDRILGIEAIANFNSSNLDLIQAQEPPKMPPYVPQQYLKPYPRSADQNFPTALSNDDISADLAIIGHFKSYDQTQRKPGAHLDSATGMRRMLETVAVPYQKGRYVAYTSAMRDDPDTIRDGLGLSSGAQTSGVRDSSPGPANTAGVPSAAAAAAGAAAATGMSRTTSLGGVAMSRQGTGGSQRGRRRGGG